MTDRKFYASIGSDYDDTVRRMGGEENVHKFLKMFKDDPSFERLVKALSENDADGSFRAAHTMKGVTINLGFTKLYNASAELTETLRNASSTVGTEKMFERVKTEYSTVMDYLNTL